MIALYFLWLLIINYEISTSTANKDLDWWQTEIIYQVYTQSFKDSNGDGFGDLKGIEEKIDYFKETGIGAIWLTPIFKSPMADGGYDILNFFEINEKFGTMEDFESLLDKLKSNNIKLILDFVPNHSSNKNAWFISSVQRIDPYTDFYVWRDPKGWSNNGTIPIPPNNWVSVFEGSAWEYKPERKQFYLHEFLIEQPDLNFRSKSLIDEIKSVLRFWLDKGVDGFRMDSINYLFEKADFPDEPIISDGITHQSVLTNSTLDRNLTYNSLNHTYTIDQPETYDLLANFRQLFDEYKQKDGHTRLILTEAYSPLPNVIKYYGNATHPMSHIPFNFQLLTTLNYSSNANNIGKAISDWIEQMPTNQWANWVLGNHDNHRMANRFSPEMVDGLNMLLLLLPGTAICYQGDELAMEDTKVRWDQTNDTFAKNIGLDKYESVSRDPERTPFQWNSDPHAGFSNTTNHTWLPVNPNFYQVNLASQQKTDRSHWKVFRDLARLRKTNAFLHGDFKAYSLSEWIFAFQRNISGEEINLVVINFNNDEEMVNLKSKIPDLPPTLNVIVASVNSEYKTGDTLTTGMILTEVPENDDPKNAKNTFKYGFSMRPNSAMVLNTIIKRAESAEHSSRADSSTDRGISSILLTAIIIKYVVDLLL